MESIRQTRLHYTYHDAGGWKFSGVAVVDGDLSIEELRPYLFDKEFFVPSMVGLKHLLDKPMNDEDHFLHSFSGFEPTNGYQSICSAEEFRNQCKRASKLGWFAETARLDFSSSV